MLDFKSAILDTSPNSDGHTSISREFWPSVSTLRLISRRPGTPECSWQTFDIDQKWSNCSAIFGSRHFFSDRKIGKTVGDHPWLTLRGGFPLDIYSDISLDDSLFVMNHNHCDQLANMVLHSINGRQISANHTSQTLKAKLFLFFFNSWNGSSKLTLTILEFYRSRWVGNGKDLMANSNILCLTQLNTFQKWKCNQSIDAQFWIYHILPTHSVRTRKRNSYTRIDLWPFQSV